MYRPQSMKFGVFIAPWHRVGEHPTLSFKRDMQVIEYLDWLGYDEAWIGEHHSFGRELISDPVAFIAAAARTTRRIKLGTGVLSLPYHHPLMVADRMLQLDHMTEGRAMLGCGPGALTSDAYMMGIEPVNQRRMMHESLDAIMALFDGAAPVNMETDWFKLQDARLQLAPFSRPHLPVSVAATFTPTGPVAAGKHGIGLLSVAGADHDAFERTWGWVEEAAAESGKQVDRGNWKVVMNIHLADSKEEAINDIRAGWKRRAYWGDRKNPDAPAANVLVGPAPPATLEEAIDRGTIICGTPDDAIEAINRLQDRSGGIGGVLCFSHEWANTDKTNHSYELLMRFVAPHFQNQLGPVIESRDWVEDQMKTVFGGLAPAFAKAFTDHGKEAPAPIAAALAAAAKAESGVGRG